MIAKVAGLPREAKMLRNPDQLRQLFAAKEYIESSLSKIGIEIDAQGQEVVGLRLVCLVEDAGVDLASAAEQVIADYAAFTGPGFARAA
jgi:hypothetical protein